MITNQRKEESITLITKSLVKQHDDGDKNSLFVRFGELCLLIEHLEQEVVSLNSVLNIIMEE